MSSWEACAKRLAFPKNDREFLASLDRPRLRHVLWLLRRANARPYENNPAAMQLWHLATLRGVHAEYKRRGWKLPKATKAEKPAP